MQRLKNFLYKYHSVLPELINDYRVSSSLSDSIYIQKSSFTSFSRRASLQQLSGKEQLQSLPSKFISWSSLGPCRGSRFATGFTPLQRKPLDSIIDLERAKFRSPEDLISVWDDFHLGRGHIGMSITRNLYGLLEERSASCRYFVIPLQRGSGYTTMFLQAQVPHLLFTGLEDYKARGTQAAPYFTVTYYTEFSESKDLVLIRGDIVFTSKLSDEEAQWLLETAHTFYLNDTWYKLVEQFNKQTRDFEFKDVLKTLNMPIG
ncbi:hypothetical protein H6P81_012239 [Aristolochia fimbriata]|uniref:ATP synthase mitochondrial F1 complex assembly factor 1 n=1 Tax=Aristolochia fimbriata TaxID=158543 RepID=A0AAV7EE17_ARIFI|nr:hypothetical protein H6P81_012239 [Aristolochia fimbriata]